MGRGRLFEVLGAAGGEKGFQEGLYPNLLLEIRARRPDNGLERDAPAALPQIMARGSSLGEMNRIEY